jgi:hypothetical protein
MSFQDNGDTLVLDNIALKRQKQKKHMKHRS